MYSIKHIEGPQQDTIEISGLTNKYVAKINLNEGGSLQQLILDDKCIIKNLYLLRYKNTYASSILFPFANKVTDKTYKFNSESHNLEINQKQEKNALHGLAYNKSFKVVRRQNSIQEILKDFIPKGKLKLGSHSWDDCFVLDSNQVIFNSPNYSFKLTSSEDGSFLQLYTPPLPNIIAIEPTTGISNSFNNGIRLKLCCRRKQKRLTGILKLFKKQNEQTDY